MTNQSRDTLCGFAFTFQGAKPGELFTKLIATEVMNPLFLFDELDKAAESTLNTLLDLLEPSQANNFWENYLGIGINLSQILIFATTNSYDKLSEPIKNRLNIIDVSEPTIDEKYDCFAKDIKAKLKIYHQNNPVQEIIITDEAYKQMYQYILNTSEEDSGLRAIIDVSTKMLVAIIKAEKEKSKTTANMIIDEQILQQYLCSPLHTDNKSMMTMPRTMTALKCDIIPAVNSTDYHLNADNEHLIIPPEAIDKAIKQTLVSSNYKCISPDILNMSMERLLNLLIAKINRDFYYKAYGPNDKLNIPWIHKNKCISLNIHIDNGLIGNGKISKVITKNVTSTLPLFPGNHQHEMNNAIAELPFSLSFLSAPSRKLVTSIAIICSNHINHLPVNFSVEQRDNETKKQEAQRLKVLLAIKIVTSNKDLLAKSKISYSVNNSTSINNDRGKNMTAFDQNAVYNSNSTTTTSTSTNKTTQEVISIDEWYLPVWQVLIAEKALGAASDFQLLTKVIPSAQQVTINYNISNDAYLNLINEHLTVYVNILAHNWTTFFIISNMFADDIFQKISNLVANNNCLSLTNQVQLAIIAMRINCLINTETIKYPQQCNIFCHCLEQALLTNKEKATIVLENNFAIITNNIINMLVLSNLLMATTNLKFLCNNPETCGECLTKFTISNASSSVNSDGAFNFATEQLQDKITDFNKKSKTKNFKFDMLKKEINKFVEEIENDFEVKIELPLHLQDDICFFKKDNIASTMQITSSLFKINKDTIRANFEPNISKTDISNRNNQNWGTEIKNYCCRQTRKKIPNSEFFAHFKQITKDKVNIDSWYPSAPLTNKEEGTDEIESCYLPITSLSASNNFPSIEEININLMKQKAKRKSKLKRVGQGTLRSLVAICEPFF